MYIISQALQVPTKVDLTLKKEILFFYSCGPWIMNTFLDVQS